MGFVVGRAYGWYKAWLMWDLLKERHLVGIRPS